ncbi:sodium/potassium-transporting ATPase subunit beta-1-interacting protein 3-like [Paramacrobiotus metropolitanus]|uniref:sodium/potassium-transporting ATPase subunit beta-1-interacting protein 3-like n=1 Tax=Paramacrobiotus metropolitanus TaxID=2943436 RepID=UPI002445E950|nr:sodium/potassium-transporting ATPase subunit beta-1-interacting protein 3-like [Paramacrobiotus metropolitanus]XP_055346953.1 sodium/potassium-transporting ATPase subunit beta-1-interacting protein 3-like [Paramacrobiotus metropolitanus]
MPCLKGPPSFPRVRASFLICSVIQLIAVFERQIFDFMGYMWLAIACNFLHVTCVILGIFGSLQHRTCYVLLSCIWNLLWIGWNIFVVCLNLDAGVLRKEMSVLNLGTMTTNWWHVNGPGCAAQYNYSDIDSITFRAKIIRVDSCLLEYQFVEVIQSVFQLALSIASVILSGILLRLYRGKDVSALEDELKPHPVPGYALSLQHSVVENGDNFYAAKVPPTVSYDTVTRINPNQRSLRNGTHKSSINSARQGSRISSKPGSRDGSVPRSLIATDKVRTSTRLPSDRVSENKFVDIIQDMNSMATAPFGPRRPVHPTIRPHPLYIPGSVSPYQSRAGTEVSF